MEDAVFVPGREIQGAVMMEMKDVVQTAIEGIVQVDNLPALPTFLLHTKYQNLISVELLGIELLIM